ncbi:TPA: nickel pincer cofactor biosynthesis protein LarC [Candidatus Poribacteria bacterium]|nr:nickel pincer cofactor biosynthesis protein LarC [Candidatus Poribacteria bacterium]
MTIAYFDCFSGISGDMILGALVDLGIDPDRLTNELDKLKLDEFTIDFKKVTKHSITAIHVVVREHNQDQKHHHPHNNADHHRHLSDIFSILDQSCLPADIIHQSKQIFDKLAEAEAKVHNTSKEKVQLHEVSGVDSIIDIVGAVIGLKLLGIDKVYASPISLGSGFVTCDHGTMPVPVPGTMEILKDTLVRQTEIRKELTTPTGAAIIRSLAENFGPMPEMVINQIGYGAGTRDLPEAPNLLRIVLGQENNVDQDEVYIIETNIDDNSPEITGHVMEKLFDTGALDVFLTPIFMKKNRPGTKLSVICCLNDCDNMISIILNETTTFGVRRYKVNRDKLSRDLIKIETKWGTVQAKRGFLRDKYVKTVPEFEDCKRIAIANDIPIREVYETVIHIHQKN